MMRYGLVALSLLLLAGCGQSDSPLFPELDGRWAPERGAWARVLLAAKSTSAPVAPPSVKDLCENEYITFDKFPWPSTRNFIGNVTRHRQGQHDTIFMIATARRDGARIILTGQEPNEPLAGSGRTRLELVMRNGEIAFDDIVDQRGRSVRYDTLKIGDPISARRAGLNTIGDMFRLLLDVKPCA
jgi:hypothetical protein